MARTVGMRVMNNGMVEVTDRICRVTENRRVGKRIAGRLSV